ncbi:hypothetical protein LTR17_003423 [Elasticomyces elasticus]|nr:hypothetical protein LTR17_003423 [Elasticomyces elasticus]
MADNKCHLLALPPELRNCVWSLVLAQESFRPSYEFALPGILQANQQTRNETLPIHYGQKLFILETQDLFNKNNEWLRTIGDLAAKQI